MARFCIVAPPPILRRLEESGEGIGSAHLLLAHDVVKHANEYRELFNTSKRDRWGATLVHQNRWIILDNSVIELGNAVDIGMIQEAVEIVNPSCVVLPDVLENWAATVESCSVALEDWPLTLKSTPFLMIPQGKTLKEFIKCAEYFAENVNIKFWGVPRNLVKNIGTRRDAIKVCKLLNPARPIHMMGFSNNLADDVLCAGDPNLGVLSIDSAVPLRINEPIQLGREYPGRGDWWDNPTFSPDWTIPNLRKIRKWVSNPTGTVRQ